MREFFKRALLWRGGGGEEDRGPRRKWNQVSENQSLYKEGPLDTNNVQAYKKRSGFRIRNLEYQWASNNET